MRRKRYGGDQAFDMLSPTELATLLGFRAVEPLRRWLRLNSRVLGVDYRAKEYPRSFLEAARAVRGQPSAYHPNPLSRYMKEHRG